ncbi:bifunctional diguanylate cyclase/phosphodiesterase [Protofrankia sp. BMG5.30]|uniref:putative bifunctional diguanylate cyclase/phosphodiesterase n=1 Tax=Protofrankia sp. BMG5.30 TaxID=1834514 RepID=UPI0020CA58A5|nr:EAL domain-containing protein [Protofrankia sp. BMG5.30]
MPERWTRHRAPDGRATRDRLSRRPVRPVADPIGRMVGRVTDPARRQWPSAHAVLSCPLRPRAVVATLVGWTAASTSLVCWTALYTEAGLWMVLSACSLILVVITATMLSLCRMRENRVGEFAGTDELTGLANRHGFLGQAARLFEEHSNGCPARCRDPDPNPGSDQEPDRDQKDAGRPGRASGALLLINIDRFREINSSLGHEQGDRLLIEVGRRVRKLGRAGNLAARIGGDEFALLLRNTGAERAQAAAAGVRDVLREPCTLAGTPVPVEASIGIAIAPDHGQDVPELLRNATSALGEAKKSSTGHRVYDSSCARPGPARLRLRAELRTALRNGEIEPYYQPKADLRTGRVTGMETLVRWRHPVDGIRTPDTFLPDIQAAGLMPVMTRQILTRALADCARWHAAGARLSVSVNVPAPVIVDPGFVPGVHEALSEAGVRPSALCVEITEDSLMMQRERAQHTLARLRALGVRVSLDDYGSGYCSLAYLRDLPADELKLDRAFLRDVERNPAAGEIVRSTLALAHTLRLRMVAEGVETAGSWALLAAWGCDEAQGYFISPPMVGERVLPWLRQWTQQARPPQQVHPSRPAPVPPSAPPSSVPLVPSSPVEPVPSQPPLSRGLPPSQPLSLPQTQPLPMPSSRTPVM